MLSIPSHQLTCCSTAACPFEQIAAAVDHSFLASAPRSIYCQSCRCFAGCYSVGRLLHFLVNVVGASSLTEMQIEVAFAVTSWGLASACFPTGASYLPVGSATAIASLAVPCFELVVVASVQ